MTDFSAALLAEYQHDLTALMRRVEKRKAKSGVLIDLLARFGQAAWILGDKQGDPVSVTGAAIKSVESLSILIDSGAAYDPDWHDRLWVVGYGAIKTLTKYRSLLWSAALRLFSGGRDVKFIGSFTRAIDSQLTEAWNAGAASVGVEPNEMDEGDRAILDEIQRNEYDFVHRLAAEIEADKSAGMEPEKFASKYGARVDLWSRRYTDTVNQARIYFGGKEKLEWFEGPTEKKCKTCPRLVGIVAYAKEWQQARIQPQAPPNSAIECGGWGCACELRPSKKRRTARALDRLLTIRLSK